MSRPPSPPHSIPSAPAPAGDFEAACTLLWLDPARLQDFARFSPRDYGTQPFEPDPEGRVEFANYLRMFEHADWDPRYPVILNISPNARSHVVDGQRRLQTYAHLRRGLVPVIHCYSRAECAHWLRGIYGLDLTGGGL